jgi:hypothetical protein
VRFDCRDSAVRDAHVGSKRRAFAGVDQGPFDQKVKRHCLRCQLLEALKGR